MANSAAPAATSVARALIIREATAIHCSLDPLHGTFGPVRLLPTKNTPLDRGQARPPFKPDKRHRELIQKMIWYNGVSKAKIKGDRNQRQTKKT
jgi:hypothetical protein